MELNTAKLSWFKALWQIATSFITDVSMTKIKTCADLLEAFKPTSTIFEIRPEYIEPFYDIIRQSPFRLFVDQLLIQKPIKRYLKYSMSSTNQDYNYI